MTPLSKEYLGSVCEVKSENNDIILAGVICEIKEDEISIIDPDNGQMPLIPYKTVVKLNIFNSRQGFKVMMGVVYASTKFFLRLVDVDTLHEFERRAFFRVNVRLYGNLFAYRQKELVNGKLIPIGPMPGEDAPDEVPTEILLENISLSGLLFSCPNRTFITGDTFDVEFMIFKSIIRVGCTIARIVPGKTLAEKQYGCQFIDITDRQTDMLCEDLFKLQRLEAAKRKSRGL